MFTERLRTARQRAGLQQIEIAERLGVARSLPGQWERGNKRPSLSNLEALAKLLNVSVSWLTGDRIGEEGNRYEEVRGPEQILADYLAPPSLRDLAAQRPLVEGLAITAEEWQALRSLKAPERFSKEGYVAVLMALRAHVT
jgi:transcriptional regulator with XRE-family HTH domain